MTGKKSKKTEKSTQDSEVSIDKRIAEKRSKLIEIHGAMSVYMMTEHSAETRSKFQNLQDRLEFRIKQYEEALLDEKITIYKELLECLRQG